MTHRSWRRYLGDAEAAAAAGADAIRHSGVPAQISHKLDGTDVTPADRASERSIRSALAVRHAYIPVLGEEEGGERTRQAGLQWIIDPLDGTTPFGIGSPIFGVLVALVCDGDPVVGVVNFPATGESLAAASGEGCWYRRPGKRRRRVRATTVPSLAEAFCSASGIHGSDLAPDGLPPTYRLSAVIAAAGRFRFVGDCLQHALVARGTLQVAIDTRMEPWDSAALIPCIREAGGVVATIDRSREVVHGGSLVSAASADLLEQVLERLAGV